MIERVGCFIEVATGRHMMEEKAEADNSNYVVVN
jgi:hypothetical protein